MEQLIKQLSLNRGKVAFMQNNISKNYQNIGVEILNIKYLYDSIPLKNKNTAILYNENQKAEASIKAIAMMLMGVNFTMVPTSQIKDKVWRLRDVLLKTRTTIVIGPKNYIISDTLVSTWINVSTLEIMHSNFELYNVLNIRKEREIVENYDNEFLKLYEMSESPFEESKITVLNPGINQPEKETVFNYSAILEGLKKTLEMPIYKGKDTVSVVPYNIDKPFVFVTSILVPLMLGGKVVFSAPNAYDVIKECKIHNANFLFIDTFNFNSILNILIGKSTMWDKLKLWWKMKFTLPSLKQVILYGEINQKTKKLLNKTPILKTASYCMIENTCIIASKTVKKLKKEITLTPKVDLKMSNLNGESEILILDKTVLHSYAKGNKFVHSKNEFNTSDIGLLKKGELHVIGSSESVILDLSTHIVLRKEIIDDYLSKYKFIAENVIVKTNNSLLLLADLDIEYCIENNISYQKAVSKLPGILKGVNKKLNRIFGVFEIEKIIIAPKSIERINGKTRIWKYSVM